MTVRELIEQLQALDPNLVAGVYGPNDEDFELERITPRTITLYNYSGNPLDPNSGYGSSRDIPGVMLS